MEYFWAVTDPRITNGIPDGKLGKLEPYFDGMVYETVLLEDRCYLDYIPCERLVVSQRIGRILKAYDPFVPWKPFVLVDSQRGKQLIYEQTEAAPVLSCAGSRTEYTQAGYIRHLVIDREKTEGKYYFYIKTRLESCLLMELSVVESLLRRKVCGLCFKRVELEN